MKKLISLFIAGLFVTSMNFLAYAEDSNSVGLRDLLNGSSVNGSNDYTDVNNYDGDASNDGSAKALQMLKDLGISGLVQLRYNSDDAVDTLSFRRAQISQSGSNHNIMVDLADGEAKLQDLALSLEALGHRVSVGQFKTPVSWEGSRMSAGALEYAERSNTSDALGNDRDRGVKAEGSFAPLNLTYVVGVFQGNGKAADNNEDKDLAGMLVFQPFNGLAFFVSKYDGEVKERDGAGAAMAFGPMSLRAEYVNGDGDVDSEGWYVSAAFELDALQMEMFENMQLAARFEDWDANMADDMSQQILSIGAQYFLNDSKSQKLSLDYVLIDGKGSEADDHGVTFGFQGSF
jgi:hypothetical protein